MKKFFAILKKDINCHLVSLPELFLVLTLSILVNIFFTASLQASFLSPDIKQKICIPALWFNFIIIVLFIAERVFDKDYQDDAIKGFLLTGISSSSLFFSKTIILFCINLLVFFLTSILLYIFANLPSMLISCETLIGAIPSIISITCLSVLFSIQTTNINSRSSIFILVLVPLLLPIFLITVEFTFLTHFQESYASLAVILWLLAVIYSLLSGLLFKFAH